MCTSTALSSVNISDISSLPLSTLSSSISDNFPELCSNETEEFISDYIPYEERIETYVVPVIFALIFVIGSIGNGLTTLIIVRERLYKIPSYLFILNLSLGDLIVILGTIPFVGTIYTFESWPYGETVCRLSEFIRDTSISVTVFTLTVMSYDRYKATFAMVLRPGAMVGRSIAPVTAPKILTMKYANIVAIIWIAGFMIGLPAALNTFLWNVELTPDKTIKVCYPFPKSLGSWYPKFIVTTKFALLYLIPLIIICFCYTLISLELRRYSINPTIYKMSESICRRHRFRRRIVIFFVLAFMTCFFPNHVFLLWFYWHPNPNSTYNDFWHIWKIFGFILSFTSSCLNPVILYMTSTKFRQETKKYLAVFFRKYHDDQHHEDSDSPMRSY